MLTSLWNACISKMSNDVERGSFKYVSLFYDFFQWCNTTVYKRSSGSEPFINIKRLLSTWPKRWLKLRCLEEGVCLFAYLSNDPALIWSIILALLSPGANNKIQLWLLLPMWNYSCHIKSTEMSWFVWQKMFQETIQAPLSNTNAHIQMGLVTCFRKSIKQNRLHVLFMVKLWD